MDILSENERRESFKATLLDLAKDQTVLKEEKDRKAFFCRFEAVYHVPQGEKAFRHFYSDIFSVLTRLKQENGLGDVDILAQNLSVLRQEYRPSNPDGEGQLIDISDCLKKLWDHVSLDVARMGYSDKGDDEIKKQEAIQNTLADINKKLETTQTNLNKMDESLQNSQKEYVAILGIFASVVLAFMGGLSFSSSVLESISKISIYRAATITLLIGLVLVNVLYLLFSYIDGLVHGVRDKKIRPAFVINITFLVLLAIVGRLWWCDIIAMRKAGHAAKDILPTNVPVVTIVTHNPAITSGVISNTPYATQTIPPKQKQD